MKVKVLHIILLLMICSIGCAQNKSMKIEKNNNSYYLVDKGHRFKVDPTILIAKPKHNAILNNDIKRNSISSTGFVKISVPDSVELKKYVSYLEKTGEFENIEYNSYYSPSLTTNDPYYETQWYMGSINIQDAWNITTGSSSIKVAVIDNGVSGHVDINDNINANAGFDFVLNTSPATVGGQHGTAVAGVISARTNNSIGIAGVAGGYSSGGVMIIPYRTDYSTLQIATAVEAAILQGVKVINMSFGGAYSEILSQAITHAVATGITVVCASGNDYATYLPFPASHDSTIAVGASNIQGNRASFSNYGYGLDLVAPGVSIFTTDINNTYNSLDGTSFSCPQVVGVAALMLSVNPSLSPIMIRTLLRSTCTQLSGYSYDITGWNAEVGFGLLNASAAVEAAENTLPHILGPTIPCLLNEYHVTNWPVEETVEWSITSSGGSLSIEDMPQPINNPEHDDNYCYVYKSGSYAKGVLTAQLKSGDIVVRTLTKTIDTGADFSGTWYQQGDSVRTLSSGSSYLIQGGKTVYLQSDCFLDATVTYTTNMFPFSGIVNNNGVLSFTPPTVLEPGFPILKSQSVNDIQSINNSIVITVVKNGTCEAYRFTFRISNFVPIEIDPMLNISNVGKEYTFSLHSNSGLTGESMDSRKKSSWQLEIFSYDSGTSVYKTASYESFLSVNTTGWKSGVYIATAIIDEKTYSTKIYIK